jgi:hypothetical protein
MLEEILRSCSNPHIAAAAVASIGGAFAGRVRLLAGAARMTEGGFAAREVIRFGEEASDEQRAKLAAAMRGSDQPILLGLQLIVAMATGQDPFASGKGKAGRARPSASRGCEACAS